MKKIFLITTLFICSISYGQTKKSTYKLDTSLILKGKLSDFNILYLAIKSPRDVTPNQLDALAKWIEGIKPVIDTIKVTK